MENEIFAGFDFNSFWADSDYALQEYVEVNPDEELISSLEQELGYQFPKSYITFMKFQNGGIPNNCCHPTSEGTSWAEDHIAIKGIFGIGRKKPSSIGGKYGSKMMIEECGYPDTGIYICDCPSGGHDMIMLDYSDCGKEGEPIVVHVDQEWDYKKTFLAKDFETFIRGLVNQVEYEDEDYI